jgi:hypothetical protein
MKRLILLLCFGLLCALAGSPYNEKALYIAESPGFSPYEAVWRAVCTVESSNDPNAIGDLKLINKSYGIAQIRKPRLDDYYRHTGIRYTVYDMFDTTKSKSVFMWYAMRNNPNDIAKTIRQWNGGPKGHKKQSTLKYYKKVLKYL